MKLFFVFLGFILILIPMAKAINCDSISNPELCEEILNSNLTNEEKEYLISDIIDNLKNFPSHDFVKEYNLAIGTSNPLENVQKYNEGYIKNAWIKLIAVMPSILENNTIYISDNGEVLSAFGHEIELPSETIGQDCKTKYVLKENKGVLNVFLNNNYQGSGRLVEFSANKDSEVRIEYEITVKTDIRHYMWNNGRCRYKYTEYKTDNLVISDISKLKYYNPNSKANFSVIDQYSGITKGVLLGNNFSSLHLSFANSYFNQYGYKYSIIWNPDSYNSFQVKAEKDKKIESNNLFYKNNNPYEILVNDISNCQIRLYDHFKNKIFPCNLEFEELNITIETDKLIYKNNETIHVTTKPSNKKFSLEYANYTFNVTNSIDIKAVYPDNRISLFYNGRRYDKIIHVKNDKPLTLLFSLSIFGGFNYIFFGFLRKYFGGIHG